MRVFTVACALFVCSLCLVNALGQSESEKGIELFGGFTRSRSDVVCCVGNANGFYVGGGYTPARFILFASEFSHAFGPDPQYVRHLHFGPQFRFQVHSLRPFGRVMAGFSEHRTGCANVPNLGALRNFSVAFGGGMDLLVHRRGGIRVISLDRIKTEDQWDTRASIGVVFLLF